MTFSMVSVALVPMAVIDSNWVCSTVSVNLFQSVPPILALLYAVPNGQIYGHSNLTQLCGLSQVQYNDLFGVKWAKSRRAQDHMFV